MLNHRSEAEHDATEHPHPFESVRERGFSLIELMAVLGVVATMLAFVIPSLTVASRNYRLKAFAKEIEGQLQNARISAINRNKSASMVFSSDNSWYYLDLNGNGTADSGESTYWAPTGGYTLNVTAPSTALSSSVLGTTSNPAALPNRGVSFSPRGSIAQVSSSQVGYLDQAVGAWGHLFEGLFEQLRGRDDYFCRQNQELDFAWHNLEIAMRASFLERKARRPTEDAWRARVSVWLKLWWRPSSLCSAF